MNIVINCVGWAKEIRGPDRYFFELLKNLIKLDTQNFYYVFFGNWQKYFYDLKNIHNLKLIEVRWSPIRLLRNFWHCFIFPISAKKYHPNLVHYPNTMPLFFKISPTICTIHDLLEYTCPQTFGLLQRQMRKFIVRIQTRKADLIIAVSDLTKDSLMKILGIAESKIRVIYNGVEIGKLFLSKCIPKHASEIFNIKHKYILFVGVIDRKKNIEGLITAYSDLPDWIKKEYQLVMAGKFGNAYKAAKALIKRLNMENNVLFLGHVNKYLEVLYRDASLLVLPSFYEGFGLPFLEAIAAGIPVVASTKVAIAQRMKDCCMLVDPHNYHEIANGIKTLLTDLTLREKQLSRGYERLSEFTWEICAQKTLDVYRECVFG